MLLLLHDVLFLSGLLANAILWKEVYGMRHEIQNELVELANEVEVFDPRIIDEPTAGGDGPPGGPSYHATSWGDQ